MSLLRAGFGWTCSTASPRYLPWTEVRNWFWHSFLVLVVIVGTCCWSSLLAPNFSLVFIDFQSAPVVGPVLRMDSSGSVRDARAHLADVICSRTCYLFQCFWIQIRTE